MEEQELTKKQEDYVLESTREDTKAYMKLIKNSRGYNWEIKAFQDTDDYLLDQLREKILEQNTQLNDALMGD